VQTETQEQVANLIRHAVEITGNRNVVVSGGYGLNCVANYYYLNELKDLDINLYVEPISNDAGTAIGAAHLFYQSLNKDNIVYPKTDPLYLGPTYSYDISDIEELVGEYGATIVEADHNKLVELITSKNIVAVFQGRSENGPRALGNRSLLFDPRFEDGKDFVNSVKRREYFRPFAGSILEEDVHEWFDLRGMPSSPTMMYAVNCQEGIAEKIPSIIHVDGTCRIQTVNREQNPHYYDIIKAFKDQTGVPIVFNTSFNLGGEPLVETLEDALWTLQQSNIEYLYLPEFGRLITINN
jgi:carbamoyltransferase